MTRTAKTTLPVDGRGSGRQRRHFGPIDTPPTPVKNKANRRPIDLIADWSRDTRSRLQQLADVDAAAVYRNPINHEWNEWWLCFYFMTSRPSSVL